MSIKFLLPFIAVAGILTACATTDEVGEEEASTTQEVKSGLNCCAICWNRYRGVDLGTASGCATRAKAFCDEPGEGRGGLYDAQWAKSCGVK